MHLSTLSIIICTVYFDTYGRICLFAILNAKFYQYIHEWGNECNFILSFTMPARPIARIIFERGIERSERKRKEKQGVIEANEWTTG